ncbi:hypothetical protein LYSHEL_22890 [Lysobacter helvus]|uniref:Uncharacterized protein n=1 Tax=Lysobacter helvus TaxID=2675059 RepID=A0ABM7QFM3_9GAMM|nr:hypothetical protein LYSHEL_22890 [Lysobacter helvus]
MRAEDDLVRGVGVERVEGAGGLQVRAVGDVAAGVEAFDDHVVAQQRTDVGVGGDAEVRAFADEFEGVGEGCVVRR